MKLDASETAVFRRQLKEIATDERMRETRGHRQHGRVSTRSHEARVALVCWRLDRRLRLGADEATLLRGAMLHDFYLYDWHRDTRGWHGLRHAARAARNAERYFGADERVKHVIRCHMWPLDPTRIPRTREAWLVCLADKYVSLCETVFRR
ncbi:MAG: HD domain-containing protein [Clostridia bacterium]|nr:HD domain-containing protein [Clostridia bacterium]